jgi:hypothetical protein
MHIYAFGSVCRGDISPNSDIDLLAIVQGHDSRFDPNDYSIYSYERIKDLWAEGNSFAWHLSKESRLIYASDQSDFLENLHDPQPYRKCRQDCEKFLALFLEAKESFNSQFKVSVFDLSIVFLAVRNFATCYSLGTLRKLNFSRNSALQLGDRNLPIPITGYNVLERTRILSTRGLGKSITDEEAQIACEQLSQIEHWMRALLREVEPSCSVNLTAA